MKILDIINEINIENGSNYKKLVLDRYNNNDLLKRVLKMTYDKIAFKYYITMKNIPEVEFYTNEVRLEDSLDVLEFLLANREVTGNAAIDLLHRTLSQSSKVDAIVLEKIIDRDLRINLGTKEINKVFKRLITSFPYMRCSLQDKLPKIKYPAIVQEKMDGTYRSIVVDNGVIEIYSRSGELSVLDGFASKLNLPDGVYIGELLVRDIPDRFKANGLLNSDTEPENTYCVAWDYLTLDEWKEGKSKTPYKERFSTLTKNIKGNEVVECVTTVVVHNLQEAKDFYKDIVSNGGEGAVLKNLDNKFKNGTALDNIKMKEEAVAEFRITGFQEGKGRFVGTLGSIEVISKDGQVISSVSGFKDETRDFIWKNREDLLNTIISVKYNGVSKSKGSDTYSLMFPVFEDFRPDKNDTDDLEYIKNALK